MAVHQRAQLAARRGDVGQSDELQASKWGINVADLRALLDRLSSAVDSRGDMPAGLLPATGVHEQARDAIRVILNAVDVHPFAYHEAMFEVGSIQNAVHEMAPLSGLIKEVHDSWLRRVLTRLGNERIQALIRLLEVRVPDFLDLLEVAERENRHSAILRWLLDPHTAPNIAPAALLSLAAALDPAEAWTSSMRAALRTDSISVVREYTIAREWTDEDRLDRIDIVISGPDFILAIENKVRAREHGDQTRRYWEWLEPLRMLRGGIFLSPSGAVAASPAFRSMSYLDLLRYLLDGVRSQPPMVEEELVMASYAKTLSSGILRTEIQAAIKGGAVS